jgi:hypothetical protein
MVWNVCCSHSRFHYATIFRPLFGTCTIYKKDRAENELLKITTNKYRVLERYVKVAFHLQIGREKNIERCTNIPPIKYPIVTRGYKM